MITDVFPEHGAPVMTHQRVRRMADRGSAVMRSDGYLTDFRDILKFYTEFDAEDPDKACIDDFLWVNNGAALTA